MTNRVEIIDWTKDNRFGGGRVFVAWEDDIAVRQEVQDDGRTLKVFIEDLSAKE